MSCTSKMEELTLKAGAPLFTQSKFKSVKVSAGEGNVIPLTQTPPTLITIDSSDVVHLTTQVEIMAKNTIGEQEPVRLLCGKVEKKDGNCKWVQYTHDLNGNATPVDSNSQEWYTITTPSLNLSPNKTLHSTLSIYYRDKQLWMINKTRDEYKACGPFRIEFSAGTTNVEIKSESHVSNIRNLTVPSEPGYGLTLVISKSSEKDKTKYKYYVPRKPPVLEIVSDEAAHLAKKAEADKAAHLAKTAKAAEAAAAAEKDKEAAAVAARLAEEAAAAETARLAEEAELELYSELYLYNFKHQEAGTYIPDVFTEDTAQQQYDLSSYSEYLDFEYKVRFVSQVCRILFKERLQMLGYQLTAPDTPEQDESIDSLISSLQQEHVAVAAARGTEEREKMEREQRLIRLIATTKRQANTTIRQSRNEQQVLDENKHALAREERRILMWTDKLKKELQTEIDRQQQDTRLKMLHKKKQSVTLQHDLRDALDKKLHKSRHTYQQQGELDVADQTDRTLILDNYFDNTDIDPAQLQLPPDMVQAKKTQVTKAIQDFKREHQQVLETMSTLKSEWNSLKESLDQIDKSNIRQTIVEKHLKKDISTTAGDMSKINTKIANCVDSTKLTEGKNMMKAMDDYKTQTKEQIQQHKLR